MTKPQTARGYTPGHLTQVRATCLYLASILGDLLDELVIVGGLVPSLLIDARRSGAESHVGTMDLDLGLQLGLVKGERYHTLAERLRGHAFEPDRNSQGHPTRQRWRHAASSATVDFLMPPLQEQQEGGSVQSLESDFAAIVLHGLPLAFRDRERVTMEGATFKGEHLRRDVPVCGPGAFVLLKALAFHNRGENKDAYDLFYVLRYYGGAVEDVGARVKPLLDDPNAQQAVAHLREDFATLLSLGPSRAAAFLGRGDDHAFKADFAGFVSRLLKGL